MRQNGGGKGEGDDQKIAKLLVEKLRSGEITRDDVEITADAGYSPAEIVLGTPADNQKRITGPLLDSVLRSFDGQAFIIKCLIDNLDRASRNIRQEYPLIDADNFYMVITTTKKSLLGLSNPAEDAEAQERLLHLPHRHHDDKVNFLTLALDRLWGPSPNWLINEESADELMPVFEFLNYTDTDEEVIKTIRKLSEKALGL